MEDLNARTESVTGDDTDDTVTNQSEGRIAVVGDLQGEIEPEELKQEQAEKEEPELTPKPDDPE